jgi:hypothetical protein
MLYFGTVKTSLLILCRSLIGSRKVFTEARENERKTKGALNSMAKEGFSTTASSLGRCICEVGSIFALRSFSCPVSPGVSIHSLAFEPRRSKGELTVMVIAITMLTATKEEDT